MTGGYILDAPVNDYAAENYLMRQKRNNQLRGKVAAGHWPIRSSVQGKGPYIIS